VRPAGEDQAIVLREAASLRVRAWPRADRRPVDALSFTHDGRTLVSAGGAWVIQLWNVATSQPIFLLRGGTEGAATTRALCIAPNDSGVAAFLVHEKPEMSWGVIERAAPAAD
jgi:hypothetical protein